MAAWLLVASAGLVACNPTLNWRDLRPAGTPLQALMPCKPDAAERSLPLGGTPTRVHMNSCEAGGMTFAVAWAETADGVAADQVLAAWKAGTLAALRAKAESPGDPARQGRLQIPGADRALTAQAQGQAPDGTAVQVRAVYFSKGRQVFQAAVYGARLPEEALTTFFEGLRLP